jgi:hypothetical protein
LLPGHQFLKCIPGWLGHQQFDGYCEKLQLAFEYNGRQHYEYVPHFHRNGPQDLEDQQERDRRKDEISFNNYVTIIVVPYWIADKRAYIEKELRSLGGICEAAMQLPM